MHCLESIFGGGLEVVPLTSFELVANLMQLDAYVMMIRPLLIKIMWSLNVSLVFNIPDTNIFDLTLSQNFTF